MALYLVIQIGAALSRVLPRSWRYLVGAAVGEVVYRVWGSKRQIARANMATVLGANISDPLVRRVAVQSMRNYCKYLIEFLELPVLSADDAVVAGMDLRGVEHLTEALARGHGVILASAHFGTIEIGGLRLKDFTDFHAVYDTFKPPYLDRLVQAQRRAKGIDLIPTSNLRAMIRVLKSGGTLVMLFDRPLEAGKGVPVRFFGRETWVPGGPAMLALRTGAVILPVYITRESGNSFRTTIAAPVTWTTSGTRDGDAQIIMQKLISTLQVAVSAHPDQWYMFRAMWPRAEEDELHRKRDRARGEPVV